jgi:hypothetical protein
MKSTMIVYNNIISPLMFGTWLLRNTNDINVDCGLNYIKIQPEPIIKLKSLKQDGFFGIKKSKTAFIKNINAIEKNCYSFTLKYSSKNIYSYSFLGIEIPEFKTDTLAYNKENNFTIYLYDKTMVITDDEVNTYYIFDLFIGKIKYPNTETNVYTFIFTQIISILISVILSKII